MRNNIRKITIYSDGACSGNPGSGGWGAVILAEDKVINEIYGGEAITTNNRMELTAIIEALQALRACSAISSICIITDSIYVKDGITRWIQNWKCNGWRTSQKKLVKNKDLWQILDVQCQNYNNIQWYWTKGHAGNIWNERADMLARLSIKLCHLT